MALIRQSDKSTPLADAIVYRLGDLVREGNNLREQTSREIENMLASARAERDRLLAGAREEGLRIGREEGFAEGLARGQAQGTEQAIARVSKELDDLLKGWNSTLDGFGKDRDSLLLEARTEVLRLAVEIAKGVLKREVEIHPETVVDQAQAALAMVARPSRVRLSVNPMDRPLVDRALPGLLARCTNATHIDLSEDPSMSRGSCIARTAGGEIDARVEVQLTRIIDAIVPPRDPPPASPAPTAPAAAAEPTPPGESA